VIGIPAGVLQVQRCEQDLNVPQFVLLGFSQSRQCNRPFATNGHMGQNPPCWRASLLLFPHWDSKTMRLYRVMLEFSLFWMSQCGNNNKLALQHGGFCPM